MKCPECKAQIDFLESTYQTFITYSVELNQHGEFHEFNRDEFEEEELINYSCPLCNEPLFITDEEALTFMREGELNK